MSKKRILVITSSLQPAGAEKYAFELVKAFDKDSYQVEILTSNDVYTNTTFPHVYFPILKSLGYKIHTLFTKPKEWVVHYPAFIRKNRFLVKVFNYPLFLLNQLRIYFLYPNKVMRLYKKFDAILLIDALHYKKIKSYLPENVYFETHLMCHQIQFDENFDIYEGYESCSSTNFVYIDSLQLEEIKNRNIEINSSHYFPLSLNIPLLNEGNEIKTNSTSTSKNIGVFTRISRMKPLEKIIASFELLSKLDSSIHLKLFGFIQDRDYFEELSAEIKSKGLENKVSFEGHSVNMIESIKNNYILVLWAPSIYNFVGYAATEVCLHKVPIILNNIEKGSTVLSLDNSESMPPYFYSEMQLAQFTFSILNDDQALVKLTETEYKYYSTNNDIVRNINNYQDYLRTKLL